MMFEGRHSLALSPEGAVILPPQVRKEMHRRWGQNPALLCFGVQFLTICQASRAEDLLACVDRQLCAAFPEDKGLINAYFRHMEPSVERVSPSQDGRFVLPPRLMELLECPRGGLLTLLGVEDHLEIWNRARLEQRQKALEGPQEKAPAMTRAQQLLRTPICLQHLDSPCSLLRNGLPAPKRCGPCVYLRLP